MGGKLLGIIIGVVGFFAGFTVAITGYVLFEDSSKYGRLAIIPGSILMGIGFWGIKLSLMNSEAAAEWLRKKFQRIA